MNHHPQTPGDDNRVDPELQSADPINQPSEDIVSVNSKKRGDGGSPAAKALFFMVSGVVVVGLVVFFGGHKLSEWKAGLKAGKEKSQTEERTTALNPEGTGKKATAPVLGAQAEEARPRRPGEPPAGAPMVDGSGIRPIIKDGRPLTNESGEALGVDASGQVVTVPAIKLAGAGNPPPLPNSSGAKPASTAGAGGNATGTQHQPSRYGGSFVTSASNQDSTNAGSNTNGASTSGTARPGTGNSGQNAALDLLRQIATAQSAKSEGSNTPAEGTAASTHNNPDGVGGMLQKTATPVAVARRMPDQDLLLPKGRQIDCVLTGRIINELAGFTSCVLTQNLYSDNGRVLLLERGSEAIGEYGTGGPNGSRRLFVVWNRVKTPAGVEIDLMSPGADPLGTSGHPGFLEQRWLERIGTALLISVMKDVAAMEVAKQAPPAAYGNQSAPWGQTTATGQSLAETILKQTINVRPTLYINEGERISIYVARDLDFAPVYKLRMASTQGGRM